MLLFLAFFQIGFGQKTKITLDIDHYPGDTVLVSFEILNRYPVLDTIISKDGHFVYEADSILAPGVYMLVFPPLNDFITVLLNGDENDIKIKADFLNILSKTKFENSKTNQLYYEYLNFINPKMKRLMGYREIGDEMKFNACADSIRMFQNKIISKQPHSFTAALLKLEKEPTVPETITDQMEQIAFRKAHYFDETNMKDRRLLRSRMFFDKLQYYIDNLTYASPDSINVALDTILSKLEGNPETYQYYLDHYMVSYASIGYVGFDAVYIHLVLNYYDKGKAEWFDKEDIKEMVQEAHRLEPLLLGKVAPDVELYKQDGTPIKLHDVDADYTIFYIWQPNCSHCSKSHPFMKKFYEKYKDKGVEIIAGCTKVRSKADSCWDYIKEHEMDQWINVNDPNMKSKFLQKYMAQRTPKIFVLDKEKHILMKDIDAEQLDEFMKTYIK